MLASDSLGDTRGVGWGGSISRCWRELNISLNTRARQRGGAHTFYLHVPRIPAAAREKLTTIRLTSERTHALTHERRSHDTRAPRAQHAGRRTRPWTWLGRVVGAPPARARAHAVAETRLERDCSRERRPHYTERECTQKFKIIGTHQIGLYIGPCSSISAYTVLRLRFDYRFGAAYTRRPAPRQRASAPASTATHGSRRACWLCTPEPAA